MATSLAPSPMDNILPWMPLSSTLSQRHRPRDFPAACCASNLFIISTMDAFWEGEARHTTTEAHIELSRASCSSSGVSRMCASVRPSMTSSLAVAGRHEAAPFMLLPVGARVSTRELRLAASSSPGRACASASRRSSTALASRGLPASHSIASASLLRSRQETAMLMAVSRLSPVIIHTRMPASSSVAIDSGTPSCSLSSMAVTPTKSRSFSMSSAAAALAASRSSRSAAAVWYSLSQVIHSLRLSTLVAMHRVRKPCCAKRRRLRSTSAIILLSWCSLDTSCRIVESAPLMNRRMVPSGERAMTLMRRRSLENSSTLSTSNCTFSPCRSR
mmetsp:Transcript_44549/g.113837  ORF Transcript_44549/g.113837 Transcript_44549/m.113837 type:complete len:331 (+) Transcript_44549:1345-2337(+)